MKTNTSTLKVVNYVHKGGTLLRTFKKTTRGLRFCKFFKNYYAHKLCTMTLHTRRPIGVKFTQLEFLTECVCMYVYPGNLLFKIYVCMHISDRYKSFQCC